MRVTNRHVTYDEFAPFYQLNRHIYNNVFVICLAYMGGFAYTFEVEVHSIIGT